MSLLDEEKDWMNKSQQIAVDAWAEKNVECVEYPGNGPQSPTSVTENSISYRGGSITIKDFIPTSIETVIGPKTIIKIDETISTHLPKHIICNSEDQFFKTFKLETYPNIQEHNCHGTFNPLKIENIKFENFTQLKFSGTNLSKIRGEAIGDPNESHLHLYFDGTLIESFDDINGLVPAWNIRDIRLDISNTKLAHHFTWEVSDIDEVSNIINSQYAWAYNLTHIRLSHHMTLQKCFAYNLDGSKKSRWRLSESSEKHFNSITFNNCPY